jgi:hypothetical protein
MTTEELIAQSKTNKAKIKQTQFESLEKLKNRLTPIIENCKKRVEIEKDLADNKELKRRKKNNKNNY